MHEDLETMLAMQAKFDRALPFITENRRLIRQGKLLKVLMIASLFRIERCRCPESGRKKSCCIYSTICFCTAISCYRAGATDFTAAFDCSRFRYRLRRTINLMSKSCTISPDVLHSCDGLFFGGRGLSSDCGFMISSSEKSFTLFARTPKEREEWMNSIKATIEEAQSKILSQSPVNSTPAALWIPDRAVESCSKCAASFTLLFRRHHCRCVSIIELNRHCNCRRCGSVVCGNCSNNRAVILGGDDPSERRVCDPCYRVLNLVRRTARKWRSLLIVQQGWLKRKRWSRWPMYYFELHNNTIRQYSQAALDRSASAIPFDEFDLKGATVKRVGRRYRSTL